MRFLLLIAALASTSASANKEGFIFTYGKSQLTGDLNMDIGKTGSYSYGINYTWRDGAIFGVQYTPDALSLHGNDPWSERSVSSSVTSLFIGHETDNSFRITGGLSLTESTVDQFFNYREEGHLGFNFGLEYVLADFLSMGARWESMDVSGMGGGNFSINFGLKL